MSSRRYLFFQTVRDHRWLPVARLLPTRSEPTEGRQHDCARTRHSYYRATRVLHEHFRADPATLGEDEFRDYILYVKTSK